jgi:hypothetical protein
MEATCNPTAENFHFRSVFHEIAPDCTKLRQISKISVFSANFAVGLTFLQESQTCFLVSLRAAEGGEAISVPM